MCLHTDGRYNEAEGQFVEVFETRKMKLAADHPDMKSSIQALKLWQEEDPDS